MIKQAINITPIRHKETIRILAALLLCLFLGLQLLVSFHHHNGFRDHHGQPVVEKANLSYTDCSICNYVAHQAFLSPSTSFYEYITLGIPPENHKLTNPEESYSFEYYLLPPSNAPPLS